MALPRDPDTFCLGDHPAGTPPGRAWQDDLPLRRSARLTSCSKLRDRHDSIHTPSCLRPWHIVIFCFGDMSRSTEGAFRAIHLLREEHSPRPSRALLSLSFFGGGEGWQGQGGTPTRHAGRYPNWREERAGNRSRKYCEESSSGGIAARDGQDAAVGEIARFCRC